MKFKQAFFPNSQLLTSGLRVLLSSELTNGIARKNHDCSMRSAIKNHSNQQVISWRVSPTTGQLEQRCSFSDSEDPPSRLLSA